jgi:hypothetical protein
MRLGTSIIVFILAVGLHACGSSTLPMNLGGISSGGDKPTDEPAGESKKKPKVADASMMHACDSVAALAGTSFTADPPPVPGHETHGVADIAAIVFDDASVTVRFADGAKQPVHGGVCGDRVLLQLDGGGVELALSADGRTLTHAATGLVFRR